MRAVIILAGGILFSAMVGCKSKSITKILLSNESGTCITGQVTDQKAFSGTQSFKMDTIIEWGPSWKLYSSEIGQEANRVAVNCQVIAEPGDTLLAVFCQKNKDNSYHFYHALPLSATVKDAWNNMSINYPSLPELKNDTPLEFYFWNNRKKEFFVDNVNLTFNVK